MNGKVLFTVYLSRARRVDAQTGHESENLIVGFRGGIRNQSGVEILLRLCRWGWRNGGITCIE